MAIYVFYHIYCGGGGSGEIIKDQMTKIAFSGLYQRVDAIYCFLLGGAVEREAMALLLHDFGGEKVFIADETEDVLLYERFTLLRIFDIIAPDDKFLYIHNKGSTKFGDPRYTQIVEWRTYMEYYLFTRAEHCICALDTHDLVGVNKRIEPWLHFSGNFWWARGSYYLKLPRTIGPDYFAPEMFVCNAAAAAAQSQPRIHTLDNLSETGDFYPQYNNRYPLRLFIDIP